MHAFDYLLKPIDDKRFSATVKRARRQIKLQTAGTLEKRLRALLAEHTSHAKPKAYAERFAVRTGSRIAFVLANEVDWIEASGDYASLHVGKRMHLLRETLNSLEARLDLDLFVFTVPRWYRLRVFATYTVFLTASSVFGSSTAPN